jgi:CRISPR type III-A/MTUBE-associated protein Csm6
MGKIILFSPVGGTDPISWTNGYDGAMLHIARVYRPDKIVLYLSAEILALHKKDNRYVYCLEKLARLQNREMPELEIIKRPELRDVQHFDIFFDEFWECINQITDEMAADDELLLNVSSGTPAMKSGLEVLQTIRGFSRKTRLIQVDTPTKKMNEHAHEGFDVELAWEVDADNAPDFKNRCHEFECRSLKNIQDEEIIKQLVKDYDYRAAMAVAKDMPEPDPAYLDKLKLARARQLLNFSEVTKLEKKTGMDVTPVKGSDARKSFEYALLLWIKKDRREYVDFCRALTPLIVDLFEQILRRQCKIDINDYARRVFPKWVKRKCKEEGLSLKKREEREEIERQYGKNKSRQWDMKKIEKDEMVYSALQDGYHNGFSGKNIGSDHLLKLIEAFCDNRDIRDAAVRIREVEEAIRNDSAHEMISVTEEVIEQRTGLTTDEILKLIKRLFDYTGYGIKEADWDSYHAMNQAIIQAIDAGK